MRIKGFICLLLAAITTLSLCACTGSSETASSTPNSDDNKQWREPAQKENTEEFVDTDGNFKFDTVELTLSDEYAIVIPSGDEQAKRSAATLQSFFAETQELELSVITDFTEESDFEILVGKTNRSESNKSLKENELEVSVKNTKLIFDGGHHVTVNSAVDKFIRLAPEKGKACVFKVTTDFSSTALDGYEYVWGDEFEGTDLNFNKWDFEARMAAGSPSIELSWDKETINVEDGRLKLRSLRYYNPNNESTQYKVPFSTLTKYKMNYVYGYAEIRCRMPFFAGSWPSFWALSGNIKNGRYDESAQDDWAYSIEIDVFEAFGQESTLSAAMHRWYKAENYNYGQIHNDPTSGTHTSYGDEENWKAWDWADHGADLSKLEQEYHLYGFEWTDKEVAMYVDGEKYAFYDITKSWDKYDDMSHFHDPIYLMFNNHLMTDDSTLIQTTVISRDNTKLPGGYFIDWIRVYQKPGVGKLYLDETPRIYPGR